MRRLFAGFVAVVGLMGPAVAGLDAASVNDANWESKPLSRDRIEPAIVKMQVLLDRLGFSPGEIDGKLGENAMKALRAFADSKGLSFDGRKLTSDIWNALTATGTDRVITDYKIGERDVKGPFLHKLPAKMEDMQGLKSVGYTSPREGLAEKFHMSEALLAALNPGQKFDQAGQQITVVNVLSAKDEKAPSTRVEVDKSKQTVKVFSNSGQLVAFFPATVGSREKPTPSGALKITSIDAHPNYRYNPDYNFKGVKSKQPFTINPGPNNPVGSHWIGLSAEGYGIHGTPDPSKVSKAESHGCVRLTNWDADRLAKLVKKSMEVTFIGQ